MAYIYTDTNWIIVFVIILSINMVDSCCSAIALFRDGVIAEQQLYKIMFTGRVDELALIRSWMQRPSPGIAAIYGRRRVGKTELIKQAFKNVPFLIFEGLEGRSKTIQITNFCEQLEYQIEENIKISKKTSWRLVFRELADQLKKRGRKYLIVIDEVQWTANYRAEFVADLKMAWEQYLRDVTTGLVLCGSQASFVVKKIIKSTALYGRTDLTINLKPFKMCDVHKFLAHMGFDEKLEAYLILGGVPAYLKLLSEAKSLYLNIQEHAFSPHAYFTNEFERIFVSHFGSHKNYEAIINALTDRPYGLLRKQLSQQIGSSAGGAFSEQLNNLASAGFIHGFTPFDRNSNSKFKKYIIHDNFINFFKTFIEPSLKQIDSGNKNIFLNLADSPQYHTWLGRAFEIAVLQHAQEISELLGFSGIDFQYGPYFQSRNIKSKGVQIDLVFDRKDKVLTICEAKFGRIKDYNKLIADFELKLETIDPLIGRRSVQKVLLVNQEPTEKLKKNSYFSKVIEFHNLIGSK